MSVPPYPLKLPFDEPYFELESVIDGHKDLNDEAKEVWSALIAYHGPALAGFELIDRVSQDTGMATIAVVRHLTELKRAGLVL